MIEIILGIVLGLAGLLACGLLRLYSAIPLYEMKRLAAHGDEQAKAIHRVAAYGASVRLILWIVTIGCYMVSFVLISLAVPMVAAVVCVGLWLTLSFVVVPSLPFTQSRARLAAQCAPVLVAIAEPLYPLLSWIVRYIHAHRHHAAHSALYEKEDFLALVAQQKEQADNRIHAEELELAHRAMTFADKQVADCMLARGGLCLVDADENLGPILMDRLHKSGQTTFLVYRDEPDTVIGTLTMRDALLARGGGKVLDLVRADLCYVHEDFSLQQVLEAFHLTTRSLAIVVNNFQECVGVITLERLMTELLGDTHVVGLDYEDKAAVAAYESFASVAFPIATEVVK